MKRLASRWDTLAALLIGLLAFAIRLKGIHGIDLGLDGGLSLALAGQPLPAALDFLAHDVHPPFFYLLLRLWTALAGSAPFAAKFLGVSTGTLAVFVLFGWTRSFVGPRAALIASFLLAVSPVAVEVDLTVREYSLAIVLMLLAARAADHPQRGTGPFVAAGVLAVWTSYLALTLPFVVALAALVRRDARRFWESVAIATAIIPWLVYATASGFLAVFQSAGPRQQTVAPVEPLVLQLRDVLRTLDGGLLLHPTLLGPVLLVVAVALLIAATSPLALWARVRVTAFSDAGFRGKPSGEWKAVLPSPSPGQAGAPAPTDGTGSGDRQKYDENAPVGAGPRACPVPGAPSSPTSRSLAREMELNGGHSRSALPVPSFPAEWLWLAVLNIVVAIVVNTFWTREGLGVRYVAPALPFLFAAFGFVVQRAFKGMPALAVLATGLVVVPSLVGTVAWYGRPTLPPSFWDPTTLVSTLDARTAADDVIVFVSAEQAGYYQALSKQPRPWILLPAGTDYLQGNLADRAATTLPDLSARRRVLWLVLYRGVLGEGTTKLGDWLSVHDFAMTPQTLPDSEIDPYLGQATGVPPAPVAQDVSFANNVRLVDARFPTTLRVNGVLPVRLRWQAAGPQDRNLTVFVHLADQKGDVVSQHDSLPENGRAPLVVWKPNQIVDDRHGLLLSSAVVPGEYWLEIGLYDDHGRLPLEKGGDTLRLGPIRVSASGGG